MFHRYGMAIVVVGLSSLFLNACSEQQAPDQVPVVRPVKVVELTESVSAATRRYPGKVRAAQRVDLSFEVAGKLVSLPVREGQVVDKGDLIATLDDRDLSSNLKSAQAENENAVANFQRGSRLVKDGNISKTDFDSLRSKRDIAAANLEKANKAVEDTKLFAPFGGGVAIRFVENFQDIQAKQPIISLQDISQLEIVVDVPESRAIKAARPDAQPPKLTAMFDALPDSGFELSIKEFSTEADPVTQTFQAVLAMPQPEGLSILPGMTATVLVEPVDEDDAPSVAGFTLPAAAVFADEAGVSQVWVVDASSNTVHQRTVETGALIGNDSIRIRSGLKAGEIVAVTAVTRLRQGMEIRPVDKVEF